MQSKNRKILIFGGSFDPPHKMHVKALADAAFLIKPDKIILAPSWKSPFKSGHWASYQQRESLIKKAFSNFRFKKLLKISRFEAERKRKTYTWQLVSAIKKKDPQADLFFLLGSDLLFSLKKWKRYEYLKANCQIAVAPRENFKTHKKKGFMFLKKVYPDFSSTLARERILAGDFSLLPKSVKKEILSKNLYFSKTALKVSKMMSEKRFLHTLSVCSLACALAEKHKGDLKKALLAALLHDCAKDWPLKKQLRFASRFFKGRDFSLTVKIAPGAMHQYASAAAAFFDFSVKDKEILDSIASHSCGRKKPTKLSRILEVADFAAADRKHPYCLKIRKTAFLSLEKAFSQMRKAKRKYLIKRGLEILPYE